MSFEQFWRCLILQFGKKLCLILMAMLLVAVCASAEMYVELPAQGLGVSQNITVNMPGENPDIPGINPLTGEVGEAGLAFKRTGLVFIIPFSSARTTILRLFLIGELPLRISSMSSRSRWTVPPV